MENENENEKTTVTIETDPVVIIPEGPEKKEEVSHNSESLLLLIGELKAKIEGMEKVIEVLDTLNAKLLEHEAEHGRIWQQISSQANKIEAEKVAVEEVLENVEEVIEESERVEDLPETPIVEEIPEEIQEEVKKRNRFFV